ncbi:retrotransposon protein, putative, ty1-copia subclass [Tanacetum coccineum]
MSIKKLHHDGLLKSTDDESFDKCVSCMSGKMARKPFPHQTERAKDLLGLIHTNVCGPFRNVSRQGEIYLVTFTEDFSRYEYTSQEFLDHLKEHGIVSQHTPPYTPQHNDVSEKRNKTLLDMVCPIMSQTTLPKSFEDYALEFAACILKMVPTKKVEKIPYKETMGYSFYYPPKNKVIVAWNSEFFENSLISQEASGSLEDLEVTQKEDTHPSKNTSKHHDEDEQEIVEPQSDVTPIHRSTRTRHAPYRMCLYVNAVEHKLGDHNEPAN